MKNIHLSILLLFVLSTLSAQSRIIESISMESELLKDSIKYSVYLPEGFENSKDKFPVVYLLNGFTGNETNWHSIRPCQDRLHEPQRCRTSPGTLPSKQIRLSTKNWPQR